MKPDGGPAFPVPKDEILGVPRQLLVQHHTPGMTLRDWFAGAALPDLVYVGEDGCRRDPKDIAEDAFRIADAMLAERAK